MTFEDVIKAAIPGADEFVCDHVLWGRTPFPMGKVTARSLYRAASRLRRATVVKFNYVIFATIGCCLDIFTVRVAVTLCPCSPTGCSHVGASCLMLK